DTNILANSGTLNIRNLEAGSYQVQIEDANSCIANCVFVINQPGCNATLDIDTTGRIICNGDNTIRLEAVYTNVTEPITFDWNLDAYDGLDIVNNVGAGTYTLSIIDANNCLATSTITIDEPELLTLDCEVIQEASAIDVADGVVRFSVSGGVQEYNLDIMGPTNRTFGITNAIGVDIGALLPGEYNVLLVDDIGCEAFCSFTLEVMMNCVSDTNFIRDLICPGDFLIINGTQYDENRSTGIEVIPGGALNGCDSIIDIALSTELGASLELEDPNCLDPAMGIIRIVDILNGNGMYEYSLNGGNAWEAVGNLPFEIRVSPNSYNLQIRTIGEACLYEERVTINQFIENIISTLDRIEIQEGDSIQLSFMANFVPLNISWSPSTTLSCSDCPNPIAKPSEQTTYNLQIIDSLGCVFFSSITVIILEESTAFIPNVFSPNGDNINDFFFLNTAEDVVVEEMMVFDRWGNLIFRNENFNSNSGVDGWDGRYKDKELNPGVFVYWIKYIDEDENVKVLKGDITLIR
ncbi:MAG: gliding motility-associated C-terminal domain-containing protein, partial [Bacteroidota bacterium]